MSLEYHYVVAWDDETGTWFTVDMQPSHYGNVWDNVEEAWFFCDTDETMEAADNAAFGMLSRALDDMNAKRKGADSE